MSLKNIRDGRQRLEDGKQCNIPLIDQFKFKDYYKTKEISKLL